MTQDKPLCVLALCAAIAVTTHELTRKPVPWHESKAIKNKLQKQPAIPIPEYFSHWRARFVAANAPPAGRDELGLVRGIFLGDDSSIPDSERVLFRNAGLSHLLAASGYNCWIVAAVFGLIASVLLTALGGFLPSLWELGARRWTHPIAQLIGAWLFWLWTDQSPPITRSVAMISGKFVMDLFHWSSAFCRLLFVQYLISLAVAPWLWHSASFQLTFGCLFGILLFPPAVERFRPQRGQIVDKVWDYFCVSLGACLGTIPTTFAVFGEINFSSLTTNWFAVPPVSFALMPLALVQMMLLAPGIPHTEQVVVWSGAAAAKVAWILHQGLVRWEDLIPSLRIVF